MKEEMSDRFLIFAVKIIELGKQLNNTFEGQHTYKQLFRAGSSSGANFEESHSAESTKDFIHKRGVVLKELRESLFWIKLISKSSLIPTDDQKLNFLIQENNELINIIAKSLATTKKNQLKK
jgi:four helix bundle protein